jgi:uncharacterized DUF497 family protein
MKLVWVSRNIEKVEAHGVTPADVEAVFDAPDWATAPSERPYRTIGEGTTPEGRLLRVIYAETEEGPFPITAFPIRSRQRRTP